MLKSNHSRRLDSSEPFKQCKEYVETRNLYYLFTIFTLDKIGHRGVARSNRRISVRGPVRLAYCASCSTASFLSPLHVAKRYKCVAMAVVLFVGL